MLNLAQREHTIDYPSENDVFVVQEIAFCGCDEKLVTFIYLERVDAPGHTHDSLGIHSYLDQSWPGNSRVREWDKG